MELIDKTEKKGICEGLAQNKCTHSHLHTHALRNTDIMTIDSQIILGKISKSYAKIPDVP